MGSIECCNVLSDQSRKYGTYLISRPDGEPQARTVGKTAMANPRHGPNRGGGSATGGTASGNSSSFKLILEDGDLIDYRTKPAIKLRYLGM